jgi:hypothetical protein
MAMTTCKECRRSVADEAPTCPNCGVQAPGEGGVERDAARKEASDRDNRRVTLGCGGLILAMALLLGGGVAWNELTRVELDDAARRACEGVRTAEYGNGTIRQATGRLTAVTSARESDSEGLREAAGGAGRVDPDTVNDDYLGVAAWCDEHAE